MQERSKDTGALILSIDFNEEAGFLPVDFDKVKPIEYERAFVFEVTSYSPSPYDRGVKIDRFTPPELNAENVSVPAGRYALDIGLMRDEKDGVLLSVNVKDIDTGQSMATLSGLSIVHFYQSLGIGEDNLVWEEEIDEYCKDAFGGFIEGNEQFWRDFSSALYHAAQSIYYYELYRSKSGSHEVKPMAVDVRPFSEIALDA